jgi:hypothetical protein
MGFLPFFILIILTASANAAEIYDATLKGRKILTSAPNSRPGG